MKILGKTTGANTKLSKLKSLSSEDEGVTRVKAFMAIVKVEPAVGKADARSNYTNVDLHYVEDQRKNLLNNFNSLKQELSSCKSKLSDLKNTKVDNISLQHEIFRLNLDNESLIDEVSDLKKVIEKWTSSKVILDQLLIEQVHGNIVRALGGRGKRKETSSSKEVLFTKSKNSSSKIALEITSNTKSDCDIRNLYLPFLNSQGLSPLVFLTVAASRSLRVKISRPHAHPQRLYMMNGKLKTIKKYHVIGNVEGRLLASFQDLEHEGREQDRKAGIMIKDKDLEIFSSPRQIKAKDHDVRDLSWTLDNTDLECSMPIVPPLPCTVVLGDTIIVDIDLPFGRAI
ncbi:hypothetical protein Tco_1263398 [Tanacetum coccineum]